MSLEFVPGFGRGELPGDRRALLIASLLPGGSLSGKSLLGEVKWENQMDDQEDTQRGTRKKLKSPSRSCLPMHYF